MTSRTRDDVLRKYRDRVPLLRAAAQSLEIEATECLRGVSHIDRVYFRSKDAESFASKAMKQEKGVWKYEHPFEELEDQVAGRVLVFYRSDVDVIAKSLLQRFLKVEAAHKAPTNAREFDYESMHLVFALTPDLLPDGWSALADPPSTFEVQVRTLAQHAWAEPQHGFYKVKEGLSQLNSRKLYWAAASAWGIDSIWEELKSELTEIKH